MFSCKHFKIFKNICCEKHLRAVVSVDSSHFWKWGIFINSFFMEHIRRLLPNICANYFVIITALEFKVDNWMYGMKWWHSDTILDLRKPKREIRSLKTEIKKVVHRIFAYSKLFDWFLYMMPMTSFWCLLLTLITFNIFYCPKTQFYQRYKHDWFDVVIILSIHISLKFFNLNSKLQSQKWKKDINSNSIFSENFGKLKMMFRFCNSFLV